MKWKQKIKAFLPPIMIEKIFEMKNIAKFKPYKNLVVKNKQLEGIHKESRCFILGSGPSIKNQDLTPLKNEIVFALNNFYVNPDFQTIMSGEKPKYYLTAPIHPPQSEVEWRSWFENMQLHIPVQTTMLFGLNSNRCNAKYIFEKYNLFIDHKKYWYFAGRHTNEYYTFNSKDIDLTRMVWSASAVSIYALLAAIYMGFNKIYLIGMDHDYFLYNHEKDMRMYESAIHQKNELHRTFGNSFYVQEFLRQYKIFKQYELLNQEFPNRIYNASAGGVLKIFDEVSLEEVLEETN
jgi:hypothetical protein